MNKLLPLNLRVLLGVAAGTFFLNACSTPSEKGVPTVANAVVRVKVASPSTGSTPGLTVSGKVASEQSVILSTRLMGYISMLTVKVGERVRKGQVLATISSDDLQARRAQSEAMIAEAEAAFNTAQKDQQRFGTLYEQQSATARELDNASLQLRSAKSRLDAARQLRNEIAASLGYARLTAPFNGTITQKLADAGNMANPGMPILALESGKPYEVKASIPENAVSHVIPGSGVTITIGAAQKVLRGTISRISPSSEFNGGQYDMTVQLSGADQEGLLSGMYATVFIPTGPQGTTSDNRVWVPQSAIVYKNQLAGLYTVGHNGTALLRWVRLGRKAGEQVEVLSGLAKNEQFIEHAEGKLVNGAAVKIN